MRGSWVNLTALNTAMDDTVVARAPGPILRPIKSTEQSVRAGCHATSYSRRRAGRFVRTGTSVLAATRRDIAGERRFPARRTFSRSRDINRHKYFNSPRCGRTRGGTRRVFISLTIYERVKKRARIEARAFGAKRTGPGAASVAQPIGVRARDSRYKAPMRDETRAARPPLLGIIYHDRRGRAGGNFVPLAAGESSRYSRPDIILLYLRRERGRVVYQQPSEPRFSPFIHSTPRFSLSSSPCSSRGRSTPPLSLLLDLFVPLLSSILPPSRFAVPR